MIAINNFLDPIRARRAELEKDPEMLDKILDEGTKKAQVEAKKTLTEAKKAMGLI